MWTIPLALFFVGLAARVDLFATGSLYTSSAALASDAILAALGFWMATAIAGRMLRPASWDVRLLTIGAAIALPVALIGLVHLLAPVTPATATAPACAGASVAGAPFRATTPADGINARSGPDTSFAQVQRFSGNCTLGFEGYCLGEPTDDLVTGAYPDQRWLILHRPWQSWPWRHMPWGDPPHAFVAAAKVQSQSPESALGSGAERSCLRLGGWREPQHLGLTGPLARGVVHIHAAAPGAQIIGLSIFSSRAPLDGSGAIFALTNPAPKRTDPAGSISATWQAQSATGPALGGPATLTLLADVCLGPAVPDPSNYAILQFAWNGQTIRPLAAKSHAIGAAEVRRLQTSACRIAPDYPKASP